MTEYSGPHKPPSYRKVIDDLVQMCHEGQGQIAARRLRAGVWNANATASSEGELGEQHRVNLLLQRLEPADREVIASLLIHAVETGVFETLKYLEYNEIEPFLDGYEGSPFNDFIWRLSGEWEWPESDP